MEKGNVLVIGNSGVGKSTLINAVVGADMAKTGWGTSGTTDKLEIYDSSCKELPFRIIDTIGFEPSFWKEQKAISAVKKWSKESAKADNVDNQINVIWFCIDGTSAKLFPKYIASLSKATSMWESVPVIVVITKSYSVPDRAKNIEMVHQAFASQKKYGSNLKKVIPVVAQVFELNDHAYASPEGITELINETNNLLPEGKKAASDDIAKFILGRKRVLAQSVVTVAIAGGVVVGAVPIPFSDAVLLAPTEIAEVNALSRIYGIGKDDDSKQFLNSIVQVGTVSTAAKSLISLLKAIPGINIGASVINAVIAVLMVEVLGEGSIYAFEQVYLGNKTTADIDWVKKIIESKLSASVIENAKPLLAKLSDSSSKKDIMQTVADIVEVMFSVKK